MVGRRQHQMMGSVARVITSQKANAPCGACKLLRRRCIQDCPFSPYFSPLEPHKFAYVHKVFGASNVSKMLMEVPEARRVDTANSLIYEASVRLRDPVYGCVGAISTLQRQIQSLHAELVAIKAEILKYKLIEEANNLVMIGSDYISNNYIVSPSPSSSPVSPPTWAAHLIDPTVITKNGGSVYGNRSVADHYIGGYFH